MDGFVKLLRHPDAEALMTYDQNAWALLSLIAYRARRTDCPVTGLRVGQCFVGCGDFKGMSRGQYREATKRITKQGFATIQTTNRGTIVTLSESSPWDINAEGTTSTATIQQPASNQPATTNKNEERKNERKKDYTENFKIFWNVYPKGRKTGKEPAFKTWQRINSDDHLKIIEHVRQRSKNDIQWLKDNGSFVPAPTTFLNQKRWQDEYQTSQQTRQPPAPRKPEVMYSPDGQQIPRGNDEITVQGLRVQTEFGKRREVS